MQCSGILSSAEHEKFCVNLPGPSGKAKYSVRPIVNQYCEGKVKSTPIKGSERVPETMRLQAVGAVRAVTACLLHNEPTSCRLRQG